MTGSTFARARPERRTRPGRLHYGPPGRRTRRPGGSGSALPAEALRRGAAFRGHRRGDRRTAAAIDSPRMTPSPDGIPARARRPRWPTFSPRPPGRGVGRGRPHGFPTSEPGPESPFSSSMPRILSSRGSARSPRASTPARSGDPAARPGHLRRAPRSGALPGAGPGSGARAAWLREKYRQPKIDAILVVTKGGLDFLLPLAARALAGLPIVLIENERSSATSRCRQVSSPCSRRFQVGETIDLARTLFPGTSRVAFVNGAPDLRSPRRSTSEGLRGHAGTGSSSSTCRASRWPELERRIANSARRHRRLLLGHPTRRSRPQLRSPRGAPAVRALLRTGRSSACTRR